jgi:hypothetical protein
VGGRYESIKYQGPEAVHDGDLCVRRKGGGAVYDKEALSEDAKGRRWVSHCKQRKVVQAASSTECLYSDTNKTPVRVQ